MLTTSRLVIKPGTLSDAPELLELNSDPDVIRYTGDHALMNISQAEKLVKERLIPQFDKYQMSRFSVFRKDGTYLGWCGLVFFPETNEVDLGYRFKKKYWGQGYATEASRACLEYGFKTLKLETIIGKSMPDNIASIKVLQKMGMTFKGYVHDPTDPHPFVRYEISREQFLSCND